MRNYSYLIGNKFGKGKRDKSVGEKISKGRMERKKRLGYINSPETRLKQSLVKKGKPAWNKGKKGFMSEDGRERLRQATLKRLANPENHYNWKGGKSFEPYPSLFTEQLKLKIKKRDKFTCQYCRVKEKDYFEKLSVHHIDYNKNNCEEKNLITLCRGCNAKANFNRSYWSNYFKEKVQRL